MPQRSCSITSTDELEFVIFCIESTAAEAGVKAEDVFAALTEETDILWSYILPSYDVLHTQSKDYIVDDIIDTLKAEGDEL